MYIPYIEPSGAVTRYPQYIGSTIFLKFTVQIYSLFKILKTTHHFSHYGFKLSWNPVTIFYL